MKNKKAGIAFLPEEVFLVIILLIIAIIVFALISVINFGAGGLWGGAAKGDVEAATFNVDADLIDFPVPKTCDTNLMNFLKFDAPKPNGSSDSIKFTYSDAIAYSSYNLEYQNNILVPKIIDLFNKLYPTNVWGMEVYSEGTEQIMSIGATPSKETFECYAYIPSSDVSKTYLEIRIILPESTIAEA